MAFVRWCVVYCYRLRGVLAFGCCVGFVVFLFFCCGCWSVGFLLSALFFCGFSVWGVVVVLFLGGLHVILFVGCARYCILFFQCQYLALRLLGFVGVMGFLCLSGRCGGAFFVVWLGWFDVIYLWAFDCMVGCV